MRSRSVAVAMTLSVLCAGGAVASYVRSARLKSEAGWYGARADAEAKEYTVTLDDATAERQLASFETRRDILERAHAWQRTQLMFVLGSVGSALAAYLFYLFFRLRVQLVDASELPPSGPLNPGGPTPGAPS